jgi:spore coat-associated protein N
MRRLVPILVVLVLAALAAVALAQVEDAPAARLTTTASSGSFALTSSREDEPIFTAANIAPGEAAAGTVTLENSGSVPATLLLRRGALVDSPGLGGGVLSDRLRLEVVDLTSPAAPLTVYSGPLGGMPDQPAGKLAPGERRTFRFTATLPDSGPAGLQNSVQGASISVAYAWVAEEAAPDAPEGGGGGGGGTSGTAGGGVPTDTGVRGPTVPPRRLRLTVPKILHTVRAGRLLTWTDCNEVCRVSISGRLRATAAGHHRGIPVHFVEKRFVAPRVQRLRVWVPAWFRTWLAEQSSSWHLRATLRIRATGTDGSHVAVRRKVWLRMDPRADPPNAAKSLGR